jgi:hypothetical protein
MVSDCEGEERLMMLPATNCRAKLLAVREGRRKITSAFLLDNMLKERTTRMDRKENFVNRRRR